MSKGGTWIEVALNGPWGTAIQPGIPISHEAIVREAIACAHAGASIVHFHAYDESTGRAFADYPGGTSLQRWHRALLRNAMVAEGFMVNPSEWWHFDYRSWRDYPLGNVAFERIGR